MPGDTRRRQENQRRVAVDLAFPGERDPAVGPEFLEQVDGLSDFFLDERHSPTPYAENLFNRFLKMRTRMAMSVEKPTPSHISVKKIKTRSLGRFFEHVSAFPRLYANENPADFQSAF
jgi:hypothetical protein